MRTFRFRQVELEHQTISSIVRELDRIGRDREQARNSNILGFMYIILIRKIDAVTFSGHIGGPDTEQSVRGVPLSIKFQVTQNADGYEQVSIVHRDRDTTYEQAFEIVKHGINKHFKELPNKPYTFDDGMDKDNWNGYYLSYSGVENNLRANFDEIFDRAVEEGYFPGNLRETCREYGFNIDVYPKSRGLTNTASLLDVLV